MSAQRSRLIKSGILMVIAISLFGVGGYWIMDTPPSSTEDASEASTDTVSDEEMSGSESTDSETTGQKPESSSQDEVAENQDIDKEPVADIDEETITQDGELSPDSNAEGSPVIIVTDRFEPNIPAGENVSDTVSDFLSGKDEIGESDSIGQIGDERDLGDATVTRMQQYYRGIPVYGAEITAVVVEGNIESIVSKTLDDIEMDIEPGITYEEGISIIAEARAEEIFPQNDGSLVIFPLDGQYVLAWRGIIDATDGLQNLVFDANTASVLLLFSIVAD